jgi:HSP20 family molecular chaperone IbpA
LISPPIAPPPSASIGCSTSWRAPPRTDIGDNYPPFDIEKLSDDSYRITLAVAGFKQNEIDITARQNLW